MQLQDYTYLLQHPEAITASQTDQLLKTIEQYPYHQPLRALHLKGLKLKKSYTYNTQLKVTAAYTTDRSVLFDYITAPIFNQNEISLKIKQNSEAIKAIEINDAEDISMPKLIETAATLQTQIKADQNTLDPNLFVKKSNSEAVPEDPKKTKSTDHVPNTPEAVLNIGRPLEFDTSEQHSFSEWLKITSNYKPIKRATINDEVSASPLQGKLAIIDRFLKKNPKIKPVSSKPTSPKLTPVEGNSDTLMTETLARIYLEQNNYDKAIQSYKILSLKYPEKSGFFAHQIKAVKELKANNNI